MRRLQDMFDRSHSKAWKRNRGRFRVPPFCQKRGALSTAGNLEDMMANLNLAFFQPVDFFRWPTLTTQTISLLTEARVK
jgi:hypothetical protein